MLKNLPQIKTTAVRHVGCSYFYDFLDKTYRREELLDLRNRIADIMDYSGFTKWAKDTRSQKLEGREPVDFVRELNTLISIVNLQSSIHSVKSNKLPFLLEPPSPKKKKTKKPPISSKKPTSYNVVDLLDLE